MCFFGGCVSWEMSTLHNSTLSIFLPYVSFYIVHISNLSIFLLVAYFYLVHISTWCIFLPGGSFYLIHFTYLVHIVTFILPCARF